MKTIPLCKALIESEELQAVEDVLKSGWLTHGPKTTEFETLFAESIGVKHAVAMNSCTSALFLAVLANGIDGEVLVPSFTFVASANAIITAGATPVFVDIKEDYNIKGSVKKGKLIYDSTNCVYATISDCQLNKRSKPGNISGKKKKSKK